LPTLQNTKLGWIVSGGLSSNTPTHKSVLQTSIKDPADHSDDTLAAIVKRFWVIEDFTSSSDVSNFSVKIALDLETANILFVSCPLPDSNL